MGGDRFALEADPATVLDFEGEGGTVLAIGRGDPDCGCGYADADDNAFAAIAYDYTLRHTSTQFAAWMRTVAEFNTSKNGTSLLDKANEVVEKYDKDYPLRFYSREHLFSDEARAHFVEADLPTG